jgi:hypothetical protein
VVLEVHHVVEHQLVQRGRLRCREGPEGDCVEVVPFPVPDPGLQRDRRHHPGDVPVEREPQLDQVAPALLRMPLDADPGLLVVAREEEVIRAGRPDEPLVIDDGGVREVAKHFARRPLPGRGGGARRRFPDAPELGLGGVEVGAQDGDVVDHAVAWG